MLNINNVVLVGRITKEPELRKTQSNVSVMSFTLAVNRRFKPEGKDQPEADFIQCLAWRQAAEFLASYCHKGDIVSAEGRIQTRNYDNEQGNKVYVTEVVAENVQLISKEPRTTSVPDDSYAPPETSSYKAQNQSDFKAQNQAEYQQALTGADNKDMFGRSVSDVGLDISPDDLPFY